MTLDDSELAGVNVATVLPLPKLNDARDRVAAESLSVNDTVLGTTACENVAVGATETGDVRRPRGSV